jgi:asparagine synthase (glutamine-hydrolysing)
MAEWINGELREFVDNKLSATAVSVHNYFNSQSIEKILQEHREKIKDNSKLIFSLLMFQIWHEEIYSK